MVVISDLLLPLQVMTLQSYCRVSHYYFTRHPFPGNSILYCWCLCMVGVHEQHHMFHLSYIFPTTTYIFFPCNFLSTGIFHAVSVLTYYGTNVPTSWSMATGAQHPLPHRPTHVYTHCLMFMTHTGQPIKHFLSPF